jgi:hypothetical protein
MKIKPSYYVLVAEILTITLFHIVKFRQTEQHPAEIVFSRTNKTLTPHQLVTEIKNGMEYAVGNIVK